MKFKWGRFWVVFILMGLLYLQSYLSVSALEQNVILGGINIMKTDVLGNGLSGAGYQIAREATQEELMNSSVTKRLLKTSESMMTVVYVSFWNSSEMAGRKVSEAITDSDGTVAIYGLPYGTYYLVESRAPEGYNSMSAPIRVTVNKYSHLTSFDNVRDDNHAVIDNTIHIVTIRHSLHDTHNTIYIRLVISFIALLVSLVALMCLLKIRRRCAA